MAYAVLEAEITGRWNKLENALDAADTRMRNMARTKYEAQLTLDTKTFGRQLGSAIGALRKIGTTRARIDLSVDGDAASVQRMGRVEAATGRLGRAQRDLTETWLQEERKRQEIIARDRSRDVESARRTLGLPNDRTGGTLPQGPRDLAAAVAAKKEAAQLARDLDLAHAEALKINQSMDAFNTRKARRELADMMSEANRVNKAVDMIRNSRDPGKLSGVRDKITGADGAGGLGGKQALEAARRGIREIGEESRRSIGWLEKMRMTILAFATGYLVIQGLGAAFRALKFVLLDYNSMLEKSEIAFTNLLDGSKQKANELIQRLETLARLTPFEFKDLVPLTQKLVALGVVAKDKVLDMAVPAIKAIGGAVARLGGGPVEIERIIRALGQMAMKGKASAEEVTQQLGELVPAAKYIAEAMGVPVAKVFELMKKGQVDGRKAVAAILYGMQRDAKDALQKLSETYEGAISNIKDAATAVSANALKPLFKEISQVAQNIAALANTKAFREWATAGITNVIHFLKMFGAVIGWLAAQIADKMPYIVSILLVLGGAKVITSIIAATKAVQAFAVATALGGSTAAVSLGVWMAAIIAFVAAYRNFKIVRDITESVGVFVLTVFKGISFGISKVVGEISAVLERIPNVLLGMVPVVGPGLLAVKTLLGDQQGVEKESAKWWDGVIASFKAGKGKADEFMTQGVSGATGYADMIRSARAEAEAAVKDVTGKLPAIHFGPTEGSAAENKARAARMRLENDRLADAAKLYDALAKAAEDSAKRQVQAIKTVTEKLQDIFGGAQEEVLKFGIVNNPLDAMITRFEKLAGIGPKLRSIVVSTQALTKELRTHAQHARQSLDKNRGGDGLEPAGALSAGSSKGAAIADAAWQRQVSGEARGFVKRCQALVRTTVQDVTHEFDRFWRGTAKGTMKAFRAAGIGTALTASVALAPGDLLYSGRGKSGHAATVGPNGEILDQYGRNKMNRSYFDYMVRPGGGGAVRGRRPGYMPKDDAGTLAGIFGGESGDALNISLQRISALPKAWGTAVSESNETTQRFRVQTLLANKELQAMLRAVMGAKFDGFVAELRSGMNELDSFINRLQANKTAMEALRDLNRAARTRGRDGDLFAALAERRRAGGDLAAADANKFEAIQSKTLRNALDDLTYSARENVRQMQLRQSVLAAGRQFVQSASVDEAGYARAVEMRGKEIDFWNESNVRSMLRRAKELDKEAARAKRWAAAQSVLAPGLKSKDLEDAEKAQRQAKEIRTSLNRDANTMLAAAGAEYDDGKAEERRKSLALARQELERQNAALSVQLPLIRAAALNETQLNDALERQAYQLDQVNRLRDQGYRPEAAAALAAELTAKNAQNASLSREIAVQREIRAVRSESANAAALSAEKQGVYASTVAGSVEQLRQLAIAEKNAALMARVRSGEIKTVADIAELRRASEAAVDLGIGDEKSANASQANRNADIAVLDATLQLELRRLEASHVLTDSMRAQMEFENEIAKRKGTTNEVTQKEIEAARKVQGILSEISRIDYAVTIEALNDELHAMQVPAGKLREEFMRILELSRNANLTEGERTDILNKERILRDAKETEEAVRAAWDMMGAGIGAGLDQIGAATGGVFDHIVAGAAGMVESVGDELAKLSKQILQNYLLRQLLGFTGLGKYMGAISAAASAPVSTPGFNGGTINSSDYGARSEASSQYVLPRSSSNVSTSMFQGANVTVNLPNVRNAEDARGIGQQIQREVGQGGSTDSRLTVAQGVADLNGSGSVKR